MCAIVLPIFLDTLNILQSSSLEMGWSIVQYSFLQHIDRYHSSYKIYACLHKKVTSFVCLHKIVLHISLSVFFHKYFNKQQKGLYTG